LEFKLVFIYLFLQFFPLARIALAGAIRISSYGSNLGAPPHTVAIAIIEASVSSLTYTIAVVKPIRLLVAVVGAFASIRDKILLGKLGYCFLWQCTHGSLFGPNGNTRSLKAIPSRVSPSALVTS